MSLSERQMSLEDLRQGIEEMRDGLYKVRGQTQEQLNLLSYWMRQIESEEYWDKKK